MFPTVPPPPKRLLVFARLPELGKVQPRLAAEVGAERALEVYESLLRHVMKAVGTSNPEMEIEVLWLPTPSATGDALRRAFGPHATAVQTGKDPGDRLSMALSERFFFHRTEKIVVISADDPSITRELIEHAFALLESCEYVLGPTTAGGYYLLGCRALVFDPSVFLDIEWCTPAVLPTTLARIAALGRTVALLPEHFTIDTAADLERYEVATKIAT